MSFGVLLGTQHKTGIVVTVYQNNFVCIRLGTQFLFKLWQILLVIEKAKALTS